MKSPDTLEQISFLATIANNTQDTIITFDANYSITGWNGVAEKLLGWKSEEVIGKTSPEILQTKYLNETKDQILESMNRNGVWYGEVIFYTKTGKKINVLATTSNIKDTQDKIIGVVVVARDISEQKKIEEQLLDFEYFFNNSNDLCGIANQTGFFETINRNFCRILGYSEKEFCEKLFIDFVHPDDVASTLQEYDKLKSGTQVLSFMNRYCKKDGHYVYLDWNAVPNPATGKLYCVARDITQRKKAEDEIINANKKFSSIFDISPVAICISSRSEGRFIQVNDAYCKITAYKREELIGKKSVDINIIGSEAREKLVAQMIHSDQNKDIEGTLRKPNGELIEVLFRVEKMEIDGQPCFICALVDITEKKKAEAKLIEANEELESFSYSVSHDLRAPLRAIHGYAKMLMGSYGAKLDSEGNRLMSNIMDNAKKMSHLIDDLLTFSRIGRHELIKTNIAMQVLVTNICNELKTEQADRTIVFDIKNLLHAQADRSAIKQVWFNLISNAIKYSQHQEKAIIEIGSDLVGNEIIYYIKDNGAGFDMHYADKLFGVFQRLHSDEEFEGTGVGLALVQRLLFKHGGRVWAEAKVNEGAIFYFTLHKS